MPDTLLTPAAIEARLATSLPGWRFENGHLCRTFKTHSWKATLMVVNAIGYLAEAAWHHPDLNVSYGSITVQLMTHDAGGITEKDFALADKIGAVVAWHPGRQGSALTGPPDDPRFAILKLQG
ncbi:MAG: 4a-hydroxytetrahydrobiopterin dehydratase [Beijerinckiaceae bacterium]